MDMVAVLRYVFDHNQQVVAGLVVVILVTAILLFIRAIREGKVDGSHSSHASSGSGSLDMGAIEAALKKVMAAAANVTPAAAAAAAASGATGSLALAGAAGDDRDTRIQELAREIDRLTSELASKGDGGGFGGTQVAGLAGGDTSKLDELQNKIDELQGKLLEYEIIEDDIADLSRFKDENAELRSELEQLKSRAVAGAPAVSDVIIQDRVASPILESVQTSVAPAPTSDLSDLKADLDLLAADEAPEPAPEVAKNFASSIQVQLGENDDVSILDDSLDTEKMLSEVASLAESGGDDTAALDETLDTDKLLAEVDSLVPGATAAAAAVSVETPSAAVAPPTPATVTPLAASTEPALEDDLLAEFKDSNDGGHG